MNYIYTGQDTLGFIVTKQGQVQDKCLFSSLAKLCPDPADVLLLGLWLESSDKDILR